MLLRRCAYCEREIPEDRPVFGFGAKAKPGIDLEPHRGGVIEIAVASLRRAVPAIVAGPGSPAAREGYDFCFMTCGESCADGLKAALGRDIAGGPASLG